MGKIFPVKNPALIILLITASVLASGEYRLLKGASGDKALKNVTLQLKWKHQFQFAGYYAAIEKGFYEEVGIKVNLIEATESQNPYYAVFEGKAEFGIGASDILLLRSQNKEAVILASIFQHSSQILLASKKSGIMHIHDLVDKRIAIEPNAADIIAYMNDEGIPIDKCIVDQHQFNVDALLNDRVDAITAYSSDEPYILHEAKYDFVIIDPSMGGIDFYGDVLFTSKELIDKNPQLVENFRKASLKGWKYAMDNREEIVGIIFDKYSNRHTKEHLRYEAERMRSNIMPDVVEIGYSNPGRWESILNTYKKLKMIDPTFTVKGLLYSDYIKPFTGIPWNVMGIFLLVILIIGAITYYFYHLSTKLKAEIKNRLRIQNDLIESEKLYRSILNASPEDITITDLEGHILMFSPITLTMFGYTRDEEVLGCLITDFLIPEDHSRALSKIALMHQGVRSGPDEYHGIRADGSIFIMEVNSEFIKDSNGQPVQMIFVIRDVTQRIQMDEALKENEEKMKKIAEAAFDPIIMIDNEGSISFWNSAAEKTFGYTPDEVIGKEMHMLLAPLKYFQLYKKGFQHFKETGKGSAVNRILELEAMRKDGTEFPIELTVSGFQLNGKWNAVGILRDITERKHAEEALRDSQSFLSGIIENNGALIYVKDREGKYELVNKKWEETTGLIRDVVVGRTDEELFPGDTGRNFRITDAMVMEDGNVVEKEEILEDESGKRYFISIKFPLKDKSDAVKGICGLSTEITKRKQAEDKLRILSQAVEQSSASIVLTDIKGNIEYVNKKFIDTTGYSFEEAIGKNPRILKSELQPSEYYIELWKTILSGKEWNGEFCNKKRNGELYWERALISPILDNDGNILKLLAVKEDITEKKKAEELLKESEEQHRLLFETAQEGIVIVQEGKLRYFNPMMLNITGYSADELLSINFLDFVFPEDRERVRSNYKKRIAGENAELRYQIRIVKKDNSLRWVEISGVKFNWKGQPAAFSLFYDITEQKEIENELRNLNEELQISRNIIEENLYQKNIMVEELSIAKEKLEKINSEKDKFFSIIAHDLRSPFQGFIGLTEEMAKNLNAFSISELFEISQEMHKSATNLFKLLQNLLEWSQMQKGAISFTPQELSLVEIVKQSCESIEQRAIQKGITLCSDIPDSLKVYVDEKMVNTIVRNLLSNAVKFTKAGGRVTISAEITDEMVELSVTDTGVGISESDINKLFKVDEKVWKQGTEGEPSTGLGLLLCKEFVEKHEGCIWVESEEGKGTKFTFTLPLIK